ncbi:MAG TPA: hypothetical protein VHV74_19065 [Pseudonocardiaceae bacterium]|jgi:hypothetical protein|nr:hypothetical protein [Pseudonocardiaceae bacterium]
MSKHHQPRINRRTAARMLRGSPVTVPDALADLLAAAAAPPRDGELVGEQKATAAFLEVAHRPTVLKPRSPSMIKSTLARLLTVKIAAVAAAVCTVGGVATAAVTGHLAPSHSSPPGASISSHAVEASVTHTATPGSRAASSAHQASPSPSLVGLCHAYLAGAGSDHGKALQNPAFTALITTAGGKTKVDAYCTALVKAKASESSSARGAGSPAASTVPGRSAAGHEASTDHPTGAPDTHRTGAPTTHPTGAPATHPTGAPATHGVH